MERIQRNLDDIFHRIAAAAARSNRVPDDITLVAITKFHELDELEILKSCGVNIFGESRVQEAKTKVRHIDGITWHLVGHLQTNKAKDAARMFEFIHSIDSLRIAEALNRHCANENKTMSICLEVNVSGEDAKWGLVPDKVPSLLEQLEPLQNICVKGLMTMAPFVDDEDTIRDCFRGLRELRDRINDSGSAEIHHLSMGMTSDYEIAVEEGATMLRIGSAIFA